MRRSSLALFAIVALAAPGLVLPVQAAPRLSPGVQLGLNVNEATSHLADNPFGFHPALTTAWSAGATLEVPVARRFSLASGLRYVEYGDRQEVSFAIGLDPGVSTTLTFKSRMAWRYVAVPVLLRFRPISSRGLFLEAGPEAGYLITVAARTDVTGLDSNPYVPTPVAFAARRPGARPAANIFEEVGTFDSRGLVRYYERFNVSLAGGAGWELPWRGHTAVVEARYTHGRTDIAKSSTLTRRTRGIELLAGWRW